MGDYVNRLMAQLVAKNPGEPEFHQAVHEVAESVELALARNPRYVDAKVFERTIEPERVVLFRVPWVDDRGDFQINRRFSVEMSSAIVPFKRGLLFSPTVYVNLLMFLTFDNMSKIDSAIVPIRVGIGGMYYD